MCDKECSCCGEEEMVEMSKEELINDIIEEISEGGCLGCNLNDLFNLAYNQGRKDTLDFYKAITDDLLSE